MYSKHVNIIVNNRNGCNLLVIGHVQVHSAYLHNKNMLSVIRRHFIVFVMLWSGQLSSEGRTMLTFVGAVVVALTRSTVLATRHIVCTDTLCTTVKA